MLTLTHHIDKYLGAYFYSLDGEVLNSEYEEVQVHESGKKSAIDKALKFYSRKNGFMCCNITHKVKTD